MFYEKHQDTFSPHSHRSWDDSNWIYYQYGSCKLVLWSVVFSKTISLIFVLIFVWDLLSYMKCLYNITDVFPTFSVLKTTLFATFLPIDTPLTSRCIFYLFNFKPPTSNQQFNVYQNARSILHKTLFFSVLTYSYISVLFESSIRNRE